MWPLFGQRMMGEPQGSSPLSGHRERPHWTCVLLPPSLGASLLAPYPALTFPSIACLCLPDCLFLCLRETLLKGRLV